jgi:hypothetical protein
MTVSIVLIISIAAVAITEEICKAYIEVKNNKE